MEIYRFPLLLALLALTHAQEYTLQLDWAASAATSASQVGYVTWNEQTLITLTAPGTAGTMRHETAALSFSEGPNQLGLYFVGLTGTLAVDGISISKGTSSINYVLNGDFEMCPLASGEQLHVYYAKIPGWNAPQISIGRTSDGGAGLLLTPQARSVTQTISFGKVSKYQFIDSISAAIQSQAKDLISANLLSLSSTQSQALWNTSFLQQNRTFTQPNPLPTFQNPQTTTVPPAVTAQDINAQVSQLLQMVTNATATATATATASLLGHP